MSWAKNIVKRDWGIGVCKRIAHRKAINAGVVTDLDVIAAFDEGDEVQIQL